MAPSSLGDSGSPLFSPTATDEEVELSLDETRSDVVMSAGTQSDLVMSGTDSSSCELSSGSAAVSAESLIVSGDDAQAGLVGARGWQPGTNCGGAPSEAEGVSASARSHGKAQHAMTDQSDEKMTSDIVCRSLAASVP